MSSRLPKSQKCWFLHPLAHPLQRDKSLQPTACSVFSCFIKWTALAATAGPFRPRLIKSQGHFFRRFETKRQSTTTLIFGRQTSFSSWAVTAWFGGSQKNKKPPQTPTLAFRANKKPLESPNEPCLRRYSFHDVASFVQT